MKNLIVLFVASLTLAIFSTIASAGLVAHWSFDSLSDRGHDDTGLGHNGTVNGAISTTGVFGNALSFNGSGDYVDVADATDLNPTSSITITAWFRADSFALGSYSWPPIVKKSDDNQTSGYALELCDIFEGQPSLWGGLNLQGGRLGPLKPYAQPVEAGTWYFAALVFDGFTLTNYLRSMEQTSFTTASNNGSGNIVTASNNLNIGRDPSNTDRFFDGAIDDVGIWNEALGAGAIEQVYLHGVPEPATLLLLGLGGMFLRKFKSKS